MQSLTEKLGAPPELPSAKNPPSLREVSLNITVSTPMAGGGVIAGVVDGKRPVRVPSVKGHMRYWWRMMNLNRPDKDERESEIFGSTEKPGKVYADIPAQPDVSLRYCNNDFDFKERYGPEMYALFSSRQNKQNIAREGFSFTLNIRYPEKYHDDVSLALSAWIYFGGLGSRTRRGCGSLSCDDVPLSLDDVLKSAPHITLWRKKPGGSNARSAWSCAVQCYRDYRQNRNKGQGNRPGRSKWPEADSLRLLTGKFPERHKPREYFPLPSFPRAALGMPIIFQFPSDRRNEPDGVQVTPNIDGSSRMASPVITKALCDNGIWYSAAVILPHDDIFGTKLKLTAKLHVSNTPIISMKSNQYSRLETTQGKTDAISGFEEYISVKGWTK